MFRGILGTNWSKLPRGHRPTKVVKGTKTNVFKMWLVSGNRTGSRLTLCTQGLWLNVLSSGGEGRGSHSSFIPPAPFEFVSPYACMASIPHVALKIMGLSGMRRISAFVRRRMSKVINGLSS